MKLVRHATAQSFLDAAREFLVAHEAENNLILGVAATVIENPARFGKEPAYFATVHDDADDRVVATALRTPPHQLVLSDANDAALRAILDDVRADALPGVVAPVAVARAFADAWFAATGAAKGAVTSERIYRLSRVVPARPVRGAMRPATRADRAFLVTWWKEFVDEALGDAEKGSQTERAVDARLASATSGVALWIVDDTPVSFAGFAGPTPNGIRIGPVFTPRDQRGHGYASALVAALSQRLLDEGRRFCFLFTNLANPTSNKIYMDIGYQPVADVEQILFTS